MKIYKLVIMMALAASAGAGTVYQVNVDTSSLTGTLEIWISLSPPGCQRLLWGR